MIWEERCFEKDNGEMKIVLEYLGEGVCGDYDPLDKEDEPLMRFTLYKMEGADWEEIDDTSYCTNINAKLPSNKLIDLTKYLFMKTCGHPYLKKICEALSWTHEATLTFYK